MPKFKVDATLTFHTTVTFDVEAADQEKAHDAVYERGFELVATEADEEPESWLPARVRVDRIEEINNGTNQEQ